MDGEEGPSQMGGFLYARIPVYPVSPSPSKVTSVSV